MVLPRATALLVFVTAGLLTMQGAGVNLAGVAETTAACAALMVFGLPHGAFDVDLIRDRLGGARPGAGTVLALYLALAGSVYLLWRVSPGLALASFLGLAAVHFAEDWRGRTPAAVALATGVALVSAPALLHRQALSDLFGLLTGEPGAARIASVLAVVAPLAVVVAAFAPVLLWREGRRRRAVDAACSLIALILLPPVVGFAVFFCLCHSPLHFRAEARRLRATRREGWAPVVAPLTLAALAVAAAVYVFAPHGSAPTRLFVASFMTLSMLTLPHMAVPQILRAWSSAARAG